MPVFYRFQDVTILVENLRFFAVFPFLLIPVSF